MLIPVGFLCDNVEVLYDLDVEAKESAEKNKLQYFRASTVTDHPKFIEGLAQIIRASLDQTGWCSGEQTGARICPKTFTRCPKAA